MSQFAPSIETIDYPFPHKPVPLSDAQKADYKARMKSKPLPKKPAAAFQTP